MRHGRRASGRRIGSSGILRRWAKNQMREEEQSLEERLASSQGVRSLQTEQRVIALLRELRWRVDHGSFYTDPTTGKLREMDVVGRRNWHREVRGRHHRVCLNLFCEVKTLRDFHVVFAPLAEGTQYESAQREWIGYHSKRLARALDEAGLEETQIGRILKHFEHACYTREEAVRVRRMMIDPPAPPFTSSAFRETNIGSDKELDNSALWRAIQSLLGCVESARRRFLDRAFKAVGFLVDLAHHIKSNAEKVITDSFNDRSCELSPGNLDLYHPVVFIEARLWSSLRTQVSEIEWCRFHLLGTEWPEIWCDVVNLKAAHKYLSHITQFYSAAIRRLPAKPF